MRTLQLLVAAKVAPCLLLAGLAGCAESTEETPLGRTILEEALETELDPIVRDSPGEWGDEPRRARVDLAVGTLEGTPPTVFGNIRSIDVDDAGRIYVLDSQAHEVRVFDADGTHVSTFGREGDGPTDLTSPWFVRVAPDGSIVVFGSDKSYRWFTLEGDHLDYRSRAQSGVITRSQVEVLDDGRILDWDFERETILDDGSIEESPALIDNPRLSRFASVRVRYIPVTLDPASEDIDTLPVMEFDHPYPQAGAPGGGSRRSSNSVGQRYWVAWADVYLLAEVGLDGTVHRSIAREGVRYPRVTDSVIDAYFRAREEREAEMNARLYAPLDRSDVPASGPVIGAIVHDDEHVVVFTEEEGEVGGFFVDVFRKSDAAYLGKVELPVEIYLTVTPFYRDGLLYGVTVHEDGFPQLIRLDLGMQ